MTNAPESSDISNTIRDGEMIIGKYRLHRRLGKGGMGTVYEAEHTGLGRRVAIKFLSKELSEDRGFIKRFDLEAKTGGKLRHENIIAVTDYGLAEDKTPFFVMEYLDGGTLRDLLQETGEFSVCRAVDIVIQACRGINAAHSEKIIHRDLKPENLLIVKRDDGTDWVKILDFGIAKLLEGSVSGVHTKTGSIIGTFQYMPPEQLNDASSIDHRADIYGLGVILYEMLSMALPHGGDNIKELIYNIVTMEPVSLAAVRPGLPSELVDIVHKAISTNPDERYNTAEAFMLALSPFSSSNRASLRYRQENSNHGICKATDISNTVGRLPSQRAASLSYSPSNDNCDESETASGVSRPSRQGKAKEADLTRSKRYGTIYLTLVLSILISTALLLWYWFSTEDVSQSGESKTQQDKTGNAKQKRIGGKKETSTTEPIETITQTPIDLPEGLAAPSGSQDVGRPGRVSGRSGRHKSGQIKEKIPSKRRADILVKERQERLDQTSEAKINSIVSTPEFDKKASEQPKMFESKMGERGLLIYDENPY